MSSAPRILMSGGGTGGHIYPALAIADAVKQLAPDAKILFVGAEERMEMQLVPRHGYEIIGLPVRGFQRKLDKRNLSFPWLLLKSFQQARAIVGDFKPDLAVGTGGFASGPALFAAMLSRKPIFLQEQNAYPGITNRMLGKRAERIFQAYEEANRYVPKGKSVVSGNPLRQGMKLADLPQKAEALAFFGLDPAKPCLLVFGGSLGARTMNQAQQALYDFWASRRDLQMIWQTGKGYYAGFSESETASLPNVVCLPYLERMDMAYAAADLVACRAGALSISELQVLGKPALLFPSPNVAGNHQHANASAVERAGGCVLVADDRQVELIPSALQNLLGDPSKLSGMSASMLGQARPDAAQLIAKTLLSYV